MHANSRPPLSIHKKEFFMFFFFVRDVNSSHTFYIFFFFRCFRLRLWKTQEFSLAFLSENKLFAHAKHANLIKFHSRNVSMALEYLKQAHFEIAEWMENNFVRGNFVSVTNYARVNGNGNTLSCVLIFYASMDKSQFVVLFLYIKQCIAHRSIISAREQW